MAYHNIAMNAWTIGRSYESIRCMAKILCVLYDDPVDGYPPSYARDDIPKIEKYDDGQLTPTPKAIDFSPGELLGCSLGRARPAPVPRGAWPRAGCDLGQGR